MLRAIGIRVRARFWFVWRRLQPAGFGPFKDEPPQAEACATIARLKAGATHSEQLVAGAYYRRGVIL
jgi:hypothetical protein